MNFNFVYILSIFCVISMIDAKTVEKQQRKRKVHYNLQENQSTIINNKELMSKLGLSEIRIPPGHSRKRLAIESRRHSFPDDSKVFIVKLPPNPYYYANSKISKSNNAIPATTDFNKMSFQSNGKLSKIYHWNLPVIQKYVNDGINKKATARNHNTADLIDIKRIPTWTKSWENETIEKSYGNYRSVDNNKNSLKKSIPTYFAPHNYYKMSNNFHKHFPGNGKPKGFYVIKNNGKKSIFYKKLIS